MFRNLSYRKFSFGYTFEENKEVISLLFINYFLCFIFSLVVILLHAQEEEIIAVTYRYHGIVAMTLLNILLIRLKSPKIARLNLLIVLPFLLMVLPHLTGLSDNEFYFWFPYIPIGFSLMAQFILHPRKDQVLLVSFLLLYMMLGLSIDNIMIYFSDPPVEIIPIVEANRFYYNFIPAVIYSFVNLGLFLILRQNNAYEGQLQSDHEILKEANENLSIQRQKLLEKNRDLDRALQQLFETRNKLVQNEKLVALGTLTAGIAHEINNPLNFISASLEEMSTIIMEHPDLFENNSKDTEQKHYLELMQYAEEGVYRVTDIVTKLGMLKSRKNLTKQVVKISSLVQAAITELQDRIPPFIDVASEIPDTLEISCNAIEIQQVLQTILSNAIDAISEKEEKHDEQIAIAAREETIEKSQYVSISISNTGAPIPENEIHKLFDPFYTTKGQGEGVGLGLSMSFNTVQQHKGFLTAQNKGRLVIFKISLPLN